MRSLRSVHQGGLMRSLRSVDEDGHYVSLRSPRVSVPHTDGILRSLRSSDHPQGPWSKGLMRSLRSDDDAQVRRMGILRSLRSDPFLRISGNQQRDNNYHDVILRPLRSHGNEQDFIRHQGRNERISLTGLPTIFLTLYEVF